MPDDLGNAGSNPARPPIFKHEWLGSSNVERRFEAAGVGGSSPSLATNFDPVAKLAMYLAATQTIPVRVRAGSPISGTES